MRVGKALAILVLAVLVAGCDKKSESASRADPQDTFEFAEGNIWRLIDASSPLAATFARAAFGKEGAPDSADVLADLASHGPVDQQWLRVQYGTNDFSIVDHDLLHWATIANNKEVVGQVLNYMDVDTEDRWGSTALSHGAGYYWVSDDVLRVLLNAGASPTKTNSRGWNALGAAIGRRRSIVIDFVDSGISANYRAADGDHILFSLADDTSGLWEALIERGADIALATSGDGRTLLHVALDADRMRAGIDAGLSVNARENRLGSTALCSVAVGGLLGECNPNHVAILLEAGADPDIALNEDAIPALEGLATPLMISLYAGCEEMARLLLEGGADPTVRSKDGRTTIHLGVAGDIDISILQLLIDAGADPLAVDSSGSTARDDIEHRIAEDGTNAEREAILKWLKQFE